MPIRTSFDYRAIFTIVIGALIFALPAIVNGFPFIFPDSGDYLVLHPLLYRSPYYGLFITFFHLNHFIWAPIAMQCLVISHLIWLLMVRIVGKLSIFVFLMASLALTLLSSLPFFTGFIMADIFTSVLFMTMYLIAFHLPSLSRPLMVYLLLLDCVATAAHITHLTLGFSLFILFILLMLFAGWTRSQATRSLTLLSIPIVLSSLAILLFNVVIFNVWSLSPAGQSFLLANLIEYGPSRSYLQSACPDAGYKICAYKDQLPPKADDLLWSTGIFDRLGGFIGMRQEAAEIVHKTIATQFGDVVTMVGRNFVRGLVKHEPAAEFYSGYQVPSFPALMEVKFGLSTKAAYLSSAEMRDKIPHDIIRGIDLVVTPIACVLLLMVALAHLRQRQSDFFLLPTGVLCFILGNTLLCTALSGVHDRYQARVTWLALMAVLLLLSKIMLRPRQSKSLVNDDRSVRMVADRSS